MHVSEDDEHYFALTFLVGALKHHGLSSVLDIGSGTGRAIRYIRECAADTRVLGVEPVAELREVGYSLGLTPQDLIDGDATALPFEDASFDVVCEFGVLHHVPRPELAIAEMLRVARKAIFISDTNNFGEGAPAKRRMKQLLNGLGLWKLADHLKTGGKGYIISAGDGLAYSYSVFNNYEQIRARCSSVHILNTRDAGINPYTTASHVALLGIKR